MKKDNRYEYFKTQVTSFVVNFGSLFSNPELDNYKYFVLSSSLQRSYKEAKIKLIAKHCNTFLNGSKDIANKFMYNYLSLKKSIDTHFMDKSQFINLLISNIYTPEIVDRIGQFIDENYDNSIYDDFITTITRRNSNGQLRVAEETIFTHEHIRTLYQISIMIQLLFPVALHYLTINKYKGTMEIKYFLSEVVENLFKIIRQSREVDLYAKLYVFVAKMVKATEKSDALGWKRQAIFGGTKDAVIEESMLKLLISMIPQFDFNQNVMNYMSHVTKATINHTLRKKDPYEISKLNTNIEDSGDDFDNGNFDIESVENVRNRKDERIMMPRTFLIDPTIDKIAENNNIHVSEDEFTFYYNSITDKINEFQSNMLCQVFSKDFSGAENILSCDKTQFTKLIIILYKLLKRRGLDDIAAYLVAKKDSYMMQRFSPRALNKKLINNENYKELIETKYRAIKNLFTEKFVDKKLTENPFIVNLMIILNNNFIYNVYGDYDKNGTLIDKKDKEDVLLEQLITVCKTMIS